MSTHVIPEGERYRHATTMECACRPHLQLTIDGEAVVHRPTALPVPDDDE